MPISPVSGRSSGGFFAASREGDRDALLALLRPAVEMGAAKEVLGALAVAEIFYGHTKVAQLAESPGRRQRANRDTLMASTSTT
jgi:ketosteroid isomerase-like protein